MPGATKPMMISGMQKPRKLPKMLLKVAPIWMMIGRFAFLAMIPTMIPIAMAAISFGSRPRFTFFLVSAMMIVPSFRVRRFLLFLYFSVIGCAYSATAMTSISHSSCLGSSRTATQERAGFETKYFS